MDEYKYRALIDYLNEMGVSSDVNIDELAEGIIYLLDSVESDFEKTCEKIDNMGKTKEAKNNNGNKKITIIIPADTDAEYKEYKQDIKQELKCCWHSFDIEFKRA